MTDLEKISYHLATSYSLRIMQMAMDISANHKADVFVRFSPHCAKLGLEIYPQGWHEDSDIDDFETLDIHFEDGFESIVKNSDRVIERLEELKSS